jgi:miniconductance mechanosensitive channel
MNFSFLFDIKELLLSWGVREEYVSYFNFFSGIATILILALLSDLISRMLILTIIARIVEKTANNWDDIIFDRKVFNRLSHLAPAIIIYFSISHVLTDFPRLEKFLLNSVNIYMIIVGLMVLNSLVLALNEIYMTFEISKNRSIKGFIQIAQILLFSITAIFILSVIMGTSPGRLLAGLGALAAVLILVFKDTILGLVASIQLSANDMVRIGDWITIDKYKADGNVTEITLNTVKVQNGDKTISTIPTYSLVSESFQNWRGMQESGGRRIKRFINIDMHSVKFCDKNMYNKLRKIDLIHDYIENAEKEVADYNKKHGIDVSITTNWQNITNLGVFRKYLELYLTDHKTISKNHTILVRQLQPTESGIPIEIYAFSKDHKLEEYENFQSDLFDHILAIIPEFELSVFQNPTGKDFRKLSTEFV